MLNRTDHSWLRHAGGASRLVQLRGIHCFETDFEKALFQAHTPQLVIPALLYAFSVVLFPLQMNASKLTNSKISEATFTNTPSFLDQLQWKTVMNSSNKPSNGIDYYYPSRPQFMHLVASRSRIQRDLTDFLRTPQPRDYSTVSNLLKRSREMRRGLMDFWKVWVNDNNAGRNDVIPTPSVVQLQQQEQRRQIDPTLTKTTAASMPTTPDVRRRTRSQDQPLTPAAAAIPLLPTAMPFGDQASISTQHATTYAVFCNTLHHANMGILALRLTTDLVEECRTLTKEILRVFEYLRQWAPEKLMYTADGGDEAKGSLSCLDEWAEEGERYVNGTWEGTGEGEEEAEDEMKIVSYERWVDLIRGYGVKADETLPGLGMREEAGRVVEREEEEGPVDGGIGKGVATELGEEDEEMDERWKVERVGHVI
jgi:hypothetical protein